MIREFLLLIGVKHCLTLEYSKEENAIVERYINEVNRHLRAFTYDNSSLTDYRKFLPFVQSILNSNHSDRLKISAAQILFGNMSNLDRGILLPLEERPVSIRPLSLYASKMHKLYASHDAYATVLLHIYAMQKNLLEKSASELLRTDLLHISTKEFNTHKDYPPGSFVLVHYRTGAPPSRLHTYWRGPMGVVNGENSRYTLFDLITNKEKNYHVSDMKPFIFNADLVDTVDVARRDYMEFFIENVISYRGNLKRKTELEFQVKSLYYDETHNSWEPYANLRDSDQLHVYLRQNNLLRLIPTKFR